MPNVRLLPPPPDEVPRLAAIEHLAPRFRDALLAVCEELRAATWPPLIYETLRTDARQYWAAPHEFWQALGVACRRHALVWGGHWLGFPDRPHVQWGGRMRRSPSPRAARLAAAGGLPAVWQEVGAL